MKPPKDVEDMAERLRTAATTPALTVVQHVEAAPAPKPEKRPAAKALPEKRVKGAGASMSVFLRVPLEKHIELEAAATKRTKETGKGVTVQQIILERI